VDLRRLLDKLEAGERLTPTEKSFLAKECLTILGRDETIRLLTRNQSYGRVLEIADEWSERLGADQNMFLRAWRGKALEDEEPIP